MTRDESFREELAEPARTVELIDTCQLAREERARRTGRQARRRTGTPSRSVSRAPCRNRALTPGNCQNASTETGRPWGWTAS